MADQLLTPSQLHKEANGIWRARYPAAPRPLAVILDNDLNLTVGSVRRKITTRDLTYSLDDFSSKVLEHMVLAQIPATVAPLSGVDAILEDRGGRYGPFIDNAVIAQETKHVWRKSLGWEKLNPAQQEALDLIAMKVSRILSGDHTYADNWLDGSGYFQLGAKKWD